MHGIWLTSEAVNDVPEPAASLNVTVHEIEVPFVGLGVEHERFAVGFVRSIVTIEAVASEAGPGLLARSATLFARSFSATVPSEQPVTLIV